MTSKVDEETGAVTAQETTWLDPDDLATSRIDMVESPDDVASLVHRIVDVHRSLPLVVVTVPRPTGQPNVRLAELDAALGSRASIYALANADLSSTLTLCLSGTELPPVYGGAIRVYRPHHGLLRTGHSPHPLIRVYSAGEPDTVDRVRSAVRYASSPLPDSASYADTARPLSLVRTTSSFEVPLPGPTSAPTASTEPDPSDDSAGTTASSALTSATQQSPDEVQLPGHETTPRTDDTPGRSEARDQSSSPRADVVRVEVPWPAGTQIIENLSRLSAEQATRLRELRTVVTHLRTELRDETARNHALVRENQRLRDQLRERNTAARATTSPAVDDADFPIVYDDPHKQLRHDLYLTWLLTVSEGERDDWPLRDYTIGPDFIASLDTVNASRRKVLNVAVQVITRRAATIPAREVRKYYETDNPGSPQCVREDGARAWRANIAHKTPQAARFLWWELPDGTVELGRAALHDDFALR